MARTEEEARTLPGSVALMGSHDALVLEPSPDFLCGECERREIPEGEEKAYRVSLNLDEGAPVQLIVREGGRVNRHRGVGVDVDRQGQRKLEPVRVERRTPEGGEGAMGNGLEKVVEQGGHEGDALDGEGAAEDRAFMGEEMLREDGLAAVAAVVWQEDGLVAIVWREGRRRRGHGLINQEEEGGGKPADNSGHVAAEEGKTYETCRLALRAHKPKYATRGGGAAVTSPFPYRLDAPHGVAEDKVHAEPISLAESIREIGLDFELEAFADRGRENIWAGHVLCGNGSGQGDVFARWQGRMLVKRRQTKFWTDGVWTEEVEPEIAIGEDDRGTEQSEPGEERSQYPAWGSSGIQLRRRRRKHRGNVGADLALDFFLYAWPQSAILARIAHPTMFLRKPNPPGTRPTCSMPYYPCPEINTELHSDSADKFFYVVERGFVVGTYTDPDIATKQVNGYRGGFRIKLARFEDAQVQWAAMCAADHGFICPVAAAELQVLPPTTVLSTAVSSTHTPSFGSAQRKFVQDAVAGKPSPLPGVQATSQVPAHSHPAAKMTPNPAQRHGAYTDSWATSSATPTSGTGSKVQPAPSSTSTSTSTNDRGATAFAKMGDGPPVEVHWGVKGVYRTYPSHLDAVAVARKLKIPDNDIIGDADPAVVEAWVRRA
ncbi:hypothetical protein B0H16DRAFT_1472468 [Mycena metata]|uniref:Uncharacterized protein n=1 Tax=Mycena metata TaxID=1033252 RepID=A0AAD7HMK7_9AGAR|nr:hypothetical protein B0H16DRAFT_1472468 [Mycena metata]